VYYSWYNPSGTNQNACVQVKGFTYAGTPTWVSFGCGTGSSGSVYWGNVLAAPEIRAHSALTSYYSFIQWRGW
jgi:hypothetical protein